MANCCYLHVGMHKTGSSSIQSTFHGYDDGSLRYLDLGKPNHSLPLVAALMPDLENYHQIKKKGLSKKDIEVLKKRSWDLLLTSLEASRGKDVIISAEYFSQPGVAPRKNLERLGNILKKYFHHVKVIAYVRSPKSFMESAFQERVKGGDVKVSLSKLYPYYRERFQKLYEVFPGSCVSLIEYNPESFPLKSVVYDFAQRVGLNRDEVKPVTTNEKLGIRALSYLYSYSLFVSNSVPELRFINYSPEFVAGLRALEGPSFSISSSRLEEVLGSHKKDLDWIAKKVCFDNDLNKKRNGAVIDSLSDLVKWARDDVEAREKVKNIQGFENNIKRVDVFEKFLDSHDGKISRLPISAFSLSSLEDVENRPHVVFRELSNSLLEAGRLEHGRKVAEAGVKLYPGAKGLQRSLYFLSEAINDLPGGSTKDKGA